MANNKEVKRTVSIFINDKEVKNSLSGVGKEIGTLKREIRGAERGSEELNNKIAELEKAKKIYKGMNDEIRETQAELREAEGDMSAFTDSISNIFEGLKTGNFAQVKTGFDGLKAGIQGATKAAWQFVATPIGAAVTALVALFAAGKAIFDFNMGLREMNKELRALGVAKEDISEVRSELLSTANTFDKEFSEIAQKANSLSRSFGISMSEANDVIARGLADGGAQNEEFLDSLGEYDEFFSAAGYSAQEFIDVVNQGFELGIYSDKLPDALKEADLSLREQTTATRDALVNAFGAPFTDSILKRIETGEITTKTALQEISAEAEKSGLTMQQQAQLTADLFRGAGEDAGGAMKVLEAVSQSAQRELNETAKAELELQAANEQLNKAQAELFEVSGFGEVWTKIKVIAVQAITLILQNLNSLKTFFLSGATLISNFFIDNFNKVLEYLPKFVEKLRPVLSTLGVDVDALKEKLEGLQFDNVDFTANSDSSEIDEEKKKLEELNRLRAQAKNLGIAYTDEMTAEQLKLIIGRKNQQIAEERKLEAKRLEEAKKRAEEERKEREKTEASITQFISAEKRRQELAAMTQKDREVAIINDKYDEQIELAEGFTEKIKEIEALRDAELQALKEERLQNSLQRANEIEEENRLLKEEADFERELEAAETQEEKDELKLEHAREMALAELEILEEKKLAELRLQEATDEEIAAVKTNYQLQGDKINREFDKQEKKLADDKVKWTEKTEKEKLAAVTQGLGAAADAFNEGSEAWKAIKISETLMSTYQSAQNAFTGMTEVIPGPVGIALGTAAAASAVINGLKNVQKISSTPLQKIPNPHKGKGKFTGGHTGSRSDAIGFDKDGAITGWVHEDEWVSPKWMTESPKYAATISWLESERQKGYFEGGHTSTRPEPPVFRNENSTQSPDSSVLTSVLLRLANILDSGIMAKVLIGYEEAQKIEDLNDERKESENNGTIAS